MALTTRCLDCGRRGSRCLACQARRDAARNRTPAQQARLRVTRRQRHRVYARDGYACVACGATNDLTLDHLVPLALQVKPCYGDHELATRCRQCNSARGPVDVAPDRLTQTAQSETFSNVNTADGGFWA